MIIDAPVECVKCGRRSILSYLRQEIIASRIIGTHRIDLRLLLMSRRLFRGIGFYSMRRHHQSQSLLTALSFETPAFVCKC